jgi:hypothetical protein
MTHRTHAAAILASAFFSGCALLATGNAAAAGPVAVEPAAANAAIQPRGHVYLFRGFAGLVFSRGVDHLAEMIENAGLSATVNEAMMCGSVAKDAIEAYRSDPQPIIIVGHSMGAACAISFANDLNAENITVNLIVTTDPNRIASDVPPNVERYINIFQSNSILGGRDIKPSKGYKGHYASYDMVKHEEVNHLNIEKDDSTHEQVLSKILLLTATPARSDSETLPIHLVVPADASLELWDSGMPIAARAGDTLKTVAARYQVPLWALTQINKMLEDTTLRPGQRIIVPRHLVPPATADSSMLTGPAPPKH